MSYYKIRLMFLCIEMVLWDVSTAGPEIETHYCQMSQMYMYFIVVIIYAPLISVYTLTTPNLINSLVSAIKVWTDFSK